MKIPPGWNQGQFSSRWFEISRTEFWRKDAWTVAGHNIGVGNDSAFGLNWSEIGGVIVCKTTVEKRKFGRGVGGASQVRTGDISDRLNRGDI